ncbi:Murein DD-endopeptidase MepM and murein hydrolase activator NlpD, contain LysM domain [Pseudoxanthomonas sp. GM95]|uniref:M23 family metallopeptidase n=1 Tax=Pseudoxanthomonas sp. GM95 TaxID=1881043 RepID=UPI0008B941CA|nr:M23 family metallopeptidase [Pseudoxanthomonas sp. GM95]SEK47969.1 Murein DD-endopeptidase MepM and murein hydrolase activator NlpD, contain LysM domain [Pseudoxanthomonas sp. GM95]
MSFNNIVHNTRSWARHHLSLRTVQVRRFSHTRPLLSAGILVAGGLVFGLIGRSAFGMAQVSYLQAKTAKQQVELEQVKRGAQQEVNAMSARLGELQAQANRLNALGERLTQMGKLEDGEFNFDEPVGVGGPEGATSDMPPRELSQGLEELQTKFDASGQQLSVLESLLFNRQLDRNATPSRMPLANTYITSGFGGRADPFGGGGERHKGIDFKANVGDPVLSVADGVVTFAGVRSGYGNVIEVDHGNGYVTRYAHNSRLVVKPGDLVRAGQTVAKAGSTGRSTGAHVHFEVWEDGRVVNPRKFLGENANTPVGVRGRG